MFITEARVLPLSVAGLETMHIPVSDPAGNNEEFLGVQGQVQGGAVLVRVMR